MASATPDPGQVALASGLTIAGWVLLVLSLLAGGVAAVLSRRTKKAIR
jgi:predicted phage tail protein